MSLEEAQAPEDELRDFEIDAKELLSRVRTAAVAGVEEYAAMIERELQSAVDRENITPEQSEAAIDALQSAMMAVREDGLGEVLDKAILEGGDTLLAEHVQDSSSRLRMIVRGLTPPQTSASSAAASTENDPEDVTVEAATITLHRESPDGTVTKLEMTMPAGTAQSHVDQVRSTLAKLLGDNE